MNFWKTLKIASLVALVIIIGFLFLVSDGSKQPNSTTSSSPATSSDGAAFNGLK